MLSADRVVSKLKDRDGTVSIPGNLVFSGASIDSRTIEPGQIFAALKGGKTDGHAFVAQAIERGAAGALVAEGFECLRPELEEKLVRVPDPLAALQELAARHRMGFSIPVVGITGSSGKTTTKEMTTAVLSVKYRVLGTEGNLNNHIGLPLTLLRLTEEHSAAVVEMGMNAPGEIRFLSKMAAPTVGVITNVGAAHLEGLGSVERVMEAKLEIADHLEGPLVVCADDVVLAQRCRSIHDNVLTFGFSEKADVRGVDPKNEKRGISFAVEGVVFNLQVPGAFNALNALAAIAVGRYLGVDTVTAARGLSAFSGAPMRFSVRPEGPYVLIDDSYNSNPLSAEAALRELGRMPGRRVAVLGDMLELGERAEDYHHQMGRLAADLNIDIFVAVGGLMKRAGEAFGTGSVYFDDAESAADAICSLLKDGDHILVKGSRAMGMEKVAGRIRDAV